MPQGTWGTSASAPAARRGRSTQRLLWPDAATFFADVRRDWCTVSVGSNGVSSFFCLPLMATAFRRVGVVAVVIAYPCHRVFEIILVAALGRQIQDAIGSHHQ